MKRVTIVVPVYGDWPSLAACITSLRKHVDTAQHRVLFINDCGPKVELMERNLKRAIKGTPFLYFRNKKNLGFVGTCNRAAEELDKTKNDVLLLNSDTQVTEGFVDELVAVLYASDRHGAVSPRSNNATLATVPLSAAAQKGIAMERSYQLFLRLKTKLPRYHEVPVAHGFCMLIRRSLIAKYGLFDTVFGRGYGEEVDFCLRIKKHGFVSVLANRAYVFHLEARSFTGVTKAKLLAKNNKIIWKRYPGYRQAVQDYMDEAQLREARALASPAGRLNPAPVLKKLVKRNARLYKLARKLARR